MHILAIDLGKHKSTSCFFDSEDGSVAYRDVPTRPQPLHDLLVELEPQRLIIEAGGPTAWVAELGRELGVEVQVANVNDARWSWRSVPVKTDKKDALKLAVMSADGSLPQVHLPERDDRERRGLIRHRTSLIGQRTQLRNGMRSLLEQHGKYPAVGEKAWTRDGIAWLEEMARELPELPRLRDKRAAFVLPAAAELWRLQLRQQLDLHAAVCEQIDKLEALLNEMGERCEKTKLLRTIPGVGPRLAELLVTQIGDPHRFRSGRKVGAYRGLTPRLHQSGQMSRSGRISKQGDKQTRMMLVEVAWLARMHNPQIEAIARGVQRGDKQRSKKARVAAARRLAVIAWAMLRDGRAYDPDKVGPRKGGAGGASRPAQPARAA